MSTKIENQSHDCSLLRKKATLDRPFFFTWVDLPNVYIAGIEYEECSECHKVAGTFPRPSLLLNTLTKTIILKPSALTGPEIRYLRRCVRKKAADFARLVGVSSVQVSRWENDHNPPERSADKLMRLLAARSVALKDSDTIMNLVYGDTPPKQSYLLRFDKNKWVGDCRV